MKDIPGFSGAYSIDRSGKVWSKSRKGARIGKFLCPWVARDHLLVRLYKNKKPHTRYVHRLVLEAFVGPCPKGLECCHNDGNPANNHLDNLRWDTRTSNRGDDIKHGVRPHGEAHSNAKLAKLDVLWIRYLKKAGICIRMLAEVYGVTYKNIELIVKRKTWVRL